MMDSWLLLVVCCFQLPCGSTARVKIHVILAFDSACLEFRIRPPPPVPLTETRQFAVRTISNLYTTWALITRIGFWGPLHYKLHDSPQSAVQPPLTSGLLSVRFRAARLKRQRKEQLHRPSITGGRVGRQLCAALKNFMLSHDSPQSAVQPPLTSGLLSVRLASGSY